VKITFSQLTNPGPRAVNEDSLDCWVANSGETVAAIADGLGGMGGGENASKLAISEFRKHLEKFGVTEETMKKGALEAHQAIREAQAKGDSQKRMATTLTAVALSNGIIVGVHCGDSRAAIARGKGIKRLSKDHSEGQRLFEAGKLTKEELANYERKHILESALGDRNEPVIDSFKFDLQVGDRVLLTTDGVHNIVMLREMQELASTSSTASELASRVAVAVENIGPSDNFSMIALYAE
jgi:serine/threonine protein phosphatase PrpC